MRNLIFILLLSLSATMLGQDVNESALIKPKEGKCMVYIARRSSTAMLIKFSIYDGETFLGKLGHNKYFAYECDPGHHVFIAKSENTSYIEADLEANKTYVIDAKVKMGIATARVGLESLDVTHKKYEKEGKKFREFVNKKKGELLVEAEGTEQDDDNDSENTPDKRMKKYYEMKEKGKKIAAITADMYFE